jgi:hypothetical protein
MIGNYPRYVSEKEIKVSATEKITVRFKNLEYIVARKYFNQITNI